MRTYKVDFSADRPRWINASSIRRAIEFAATLSSSEPVTITPLPFGAPLAIERKQVEA